MRANFQEFLELDSLNVVNRQTMYLTRVQALLSLKANATVLGVGNYGRLFFLVQLYLYIQLLVYIQFLLDIHAVHDQTFWDLFTDVLFTKHLVCHVLDLLNRINRMDSAVKSTLFEIAGRSSLCLDLCLDNKLPRSLF